MPILRQKRAKKCFENEVLNELLKQHGYYFDKKNKEFNRRVEHSITFDMYNQFCLMPYDVLLKVLDNLPLQ